MRTQRSREGRGPAAYARHVMIMSGMAALAVVASACSSNGSQAPTSSGTTSTAAASPAASGPATSGSGLLAKYEAQPTFTAPGPAFNAEAAAGKTVWAIPTTSQNSVVTQTEAALQAALALAGVKTHLVTTSGLESDWTTGITNAIAQKAGAIILLGISPQLIAPQLAQAAKADIPVVYTWSYLGSPAPTYLNVGAYVAIDYPTIGQVLIQQAIADTNGKAHIAIIRSPDLPPQTWMTQSMQSYLPTTGCTQCKIEKVIAIPIADWAADINTDVRSALIADPSINVIIPLSDGMSEWVTPAVREANSTAKVETVDATPVFAEQVGKGAISADMGWSDPWVGWASADQALRLMTGHPAAPNENVPNVLVNSTNATKASGNLSPLFGAAYIGGYEKLWGVS